MKKATLGTPVSARLKSMTTTSDTPTPTAPAPSVPRLPSLRVTAALAAGMLAIGVAAGAAIGPRVGEPDSALASNPGILQKLPALIASLAAGRPPGSTQQATAPTRPPVIAPGTTPTAASATPASTTHDASTTKASSPSPATYSASQPSVPTPTSTPTNKTSNGATLPPVTNVWLIELSGSSFAQALAKPTAAPYITSQLIGKGAYLSSWPALSGSAFANDAALAGHRSAAGGQPPLLHSIVQPPCPEGPAGAACTGGSTGQLTAADEFLKAVLATIIASTTYGEHGLVVVTFATVGVATASELPAGASTATLTSQPPAGVLLLSPFAKAGTRPAIAFNPTAPKQSLEKLLH
jgi:hypothetical protein